MSLDSDRRSDLSTLDPEQPLLKALVQTIPDMVWLKDPAGVYLACNSAAQELLGRPESEVLGKTDYDFFPVEEADLYRARDQQAAASQDPVTHRECITFHDGRRALVETIKRAMRDSSGRLVGVLGIARDITATDATEKALRDRLASQEALERIAATLPGVIYAYRRRPDGTTCVPYASAALTDLFGLRPEDLAESAAAFAALLHPDDVPHIAAGLDESARSLSMWHGEFRFQHPRKGEIWIEGQATPVREADGGVLWQGFLTDVTHRKRMEEDLRASEARLKEAQRLAKLGSWVWDLQSGLIHVSEGMNLLNGRDPESPPIPLAELHRSYPAESWERLRTAMELARTTGVPYELDLEVIRPDGQHVWRTARGEAERDAGGRIVRVRGTSQDITARKNAERELQNSEARFRTLIEDAPIAISLARQGRVVYGNPMYLRMFGFQRVEDIYDKPVIELFAPQCRGEVIDRATKREQGLPVPREYEAIGRRVDGTEFPMLLAVMTMQFAEGPALVAFVTDLTVLRQAQEDRSRLEQQFRQAQKLESIGRLAGGVAHDFNNLLTVINGYSRMLLDDLNARDPMRETIEEIHSAGERAAALTQQLLAFSRKQLLQPKVLDLNHVVVQLRPMLARLLGEDIQVDVELDWKAPAIYADPHQLEQVIMNLAVNSRDAMPQGGKLCIRTAAVEWDEKDVQLHLGAHPGRYAALEVSDTGMGMDEETRRHIFEPFFTTKEVGKGTGLGLSMILGIVEQSGGYVEVNSQPGRGTTFQIYMPVVEDVPADSDKRENVRAMGGRETVLVVEDQAEVRKYAASALRSYGYRVIQAQNAGEALLICERQPARVDLVLTDVVMPNLSGRELADLLEKRWPGIKVLFMSGYTDDSIVHHGVRQGDAAMIQKPFSPEQLAIKVREILSAPVSPLQF